MLRRHNCFTGFGNKVGSAWLCGRSASSGRRDRCRLGGEAGRAPQHFAYTRLRRYNRTAPWQPAMMLRR
ncbi:hypothetical protein NDU88_003674 [Pleurodeles waltl]|uniref:Uncharacterized protein n=1 Tax=Pleurodeles waltl TaxID=8319 RepID=A0AAV7WUA4_PLEWA|nr:hypothetical protein NDU88_003674 [Pleurodeles waltl]